MNSPGVKVECVKREAYHDVDAFPTEPYKVDDSGIILLLLD